MLTKNKKEIEKLKREIKRKDELIDYYVKYIDELHKKKAEENYKDYDWAVLCKDYKLTVINGGKIENKVRSINVECDLGLIPTITIEK